MPDTRIESEEVTEYKEPGSETESDNDGAQLVRVIGGLVAATLMGLVFGFLFEKSHVYEPASIRGQFNFERWVMLKMFMGAVAGSCVAFSIISVVAPERFDAVRRSFHPCTRGYLSGGILGGAILGLGMVIAGACPGMVLPQVGTNLPNSLFTVAGGLIGALTFGLLEPVLRPRLLNKGPQCPSDSQAFLDVKLNTRFVTLCLPLGLMCGALAVVLELLVDFEDDLGLTDETNAGNPFASRAWPPSLCGALIGLLQFPAVAFMDDSLGSSGGYQCIAAQWIHLVPSAQDKFSYLYGFSHGLGAWWQVFYLVAAVLGAFLSAMYSESLPTSASGVSVPEALIGGFLMIFGSRLGGGCTSGHGISGMPFLHGLSVIAVCVMFAVCIAFGLILDALNLLEIPPLVGHF